MAVQVHVTAWPPTRTVTVAVAGELDERSGSALAALLARLDTELVATVVVDLAQAHLPGAVPRSVLRALRPPAPAPGRGHRALINAPHTAAPLSACAAPNLLWHERDPNALPWPDALRHARPTAGVCDCARPGGTDKCSRCAQGCTAGQAATAGDKPGVATDTASYPVRLRRGRAAELRNRAAAGSLRA